jgi:hypothetical protein
VDLWKMILKLAALNLLQRSPHPTPRKKEKTKNSGASRVAFAKHF